MKRIILILALSLIETINLNAQNPSDQDCVTRIDTIENEIVHSTICGNEIVDTLKVYDLKERLIRWQYFGSKGKPNELIETWSKLHKGPLRISTGYFNRASQKVGIWKYYHKKGYLWDEEEFKEGVRVRRTRYKSNGEIAFEK